MRPLDAVSKAMLTGGDCRQPVQSLLNDRSGESRFIPHPLGFLRALLGESAQGLLYLHCWPSHDGYLQSRDLLVHQHSVPLTSYVIAGSILDITYDWLDEPEAPLQLFRQNRGAEGPRLTQSCRFGRLIEKSQRRICERQLYCISDTVFHQSVIDWSSLVATVCLFVGRSERYPLVVAPTSLKAPPVYSPGLVAEGDSRILYRRILAKVNDE